MSANPEEDLVGLFGWTIKTIVRRLIGLGKSVQDFIRAEKNRS